MQAPPTYPSTPPHSHPHPPRQATLLGKAVAREKAVARLAAMRAKSGAASPAKPELMASGSGGGGGDKES